MVREERAGTVGLKARDSQREEDPERQRRVKDSSDIHLVLQYLSLTWTDSVSAERSELDHSLYTHTHWRCVEQRLRRKGPKVGADAANFLSTNNNSVVWTH